MTPPNMLSLILSHFSRINRRRADMTSPDVGWAFLVNFLAILAYAPLLSEPACLISALCDARLNQQAGDVGWTRDHVLLDGRRFFPAHELSLERFLGARSNLFPMKTFHELASQRRLRVARLHRQHLGLLLRIKT